MVTKIYIHKQIKSYRIFEWLYLPEIFNNDKKT